MVECTDYLTYRRGFEGYVVGVKVCFTKGCWLLKWRRDGEVEVEGGAYVLAEKL